MIRVHPAYLRGLHRAWVNFIAWSLRQQTGEPANFADQVRAALADESPLGDLSDALNALFDAWAKHSLSEEVVTAQTSGAE